jgi:outer membrane protein OmpA-like peptidoglycan-associated protein/outer membrane protein W
LLAIATLVLPLRAVAEDYAWQVRIGATHVEPNSDVLALPTGMLRIDDDLNVSADLTAMITPRFGVELYAGRFDHGLLVDVSLDDSQGIGSVDFTPVIATAQWHLLPEARVRPYVGAGVGFARFGGTGGAGFDVDDAVGPVAQLGVDVGITERLLANFAVRWMSVEADVKQAGVPLGEAEIDPYLFSVHVGWRFGRRDEPVAAAPTPAPEPAPAPAPEPAPSRAIESAPPASPTPIPADTDRDGVLDDADRCPGTAPGTRVGPQGCSCDLNVQLTFGTDSAELTADDRRLLDGAVEELQRVPFTGVIEGHTDSVGADAYNRALSERRARAVRDYLASRGLDPQRMRVVGYGETRPAGDNSTASGRAENRRVVLRRTDCAP